MTVHVGTSGFSYPGWKGQFYPSDLKSQDFFGYYAKKLNSVEINSSFYVPPSQVMVKSWASKSSETFRLAFKAPKQITHIQKLAGKSAVESANRLNQTLTLLGSRKGPVLYQLPPYQHQDLTILEQFLENTSEIGGRVFEFRHGSWLTDSTYKLLDKHNASFCIAESEDMEPVFQVTGGMAYFRLRKDHYDEKTIGEWTGKVKKTIKNVSEAYVFLRHDETGMNAAYARKLMEELK